MLTQAEQLAEEYQRSLEFVQRGLESCRLAGVCDEYFINRYLKHDLTVPFDPAVDSKSRELQKQLRG